MRNSERDKESFESERVSNRVILSRGELAERERGERGVRESKQKSE